MSNVPPHKRIFNRNPAPISGSSSVTSNPSPPLANVTSQTPSSPSKIWYSRRRFISHWYATSAESLAVVPYNYGGTEIGLKPLTVTDKAGLVEEEEIGVLRGIVEKLARDLIKASQHAEEKEIEGVDPKLLMMEKIEIVNVQLLVMVGKILFVGDPSACLDSIKKALANEGEFNNNKKAQKTFYSRVSEEYIREVKQLLVDKCEFESVGAKQRYHIKIIDKRQGNLNISCKCKASHDSTLELYKVEQNPLKHMVTVVSCLSKNFDLRIMINTKRVFKNLDADVMDGINQLINLCCCYRPRGRGGGGGGAQVAFREGVSCWPIFYSWCMAYKTHNFK